MSGCLRQIIWANEYMRKDSKVRIYKTCIRPIMTYGIETRQETNKTKSMLRVAEMKTLRTIMGKQEWTELGKLTLGNNVGCKSP